MSRLPGGIHQRHVEYELPGSCSSSSVGLQSVSLTSNLPHSQSWTVVPEFNMSLRQQKEVDPFEQDSLEQYPDPSARYLQANLTSPKMEPDFDQRKVGQLKQQTRKIANSLTYDLGRK